MTIGVGTLVAVVTAYLLQPEWAHDGAWHRQEAPLEALESLTGGSLLPATENQPLPDCPEAQRQRARQQWAPYLQRYPIDAVFVYRRGCLELASGDMRERKPVFGLFRLWTHLLQGMVLSRELASADGIKTLAAESGQPAFPGAPELRDALEQLAWGTPIRQVLDDAPRAARRQWAGQRLALELEALGGLPLHQLLQEWLRAPLRVSGDAAIALDSTGAPLAFCCYYAAAEEVLRLGRVYLGERADGLALPEGWRARIGQRLAADSHLFRAQGQYLYWNIQYGVVIYLRASALTSPNDINYLAELMGLLAQSAPGAR